MIPRRRFGLIPGLAALLCAGLLLGHLRSSSPPTALHRQHAAATIAAPAAAPFAAEPATAAVHVRDPERALREGSLRGTVADGGVSTGFGGRLKPDRALRRLFDYYLTLLGETDLRGIRQLLHEDLLHRHLDALLVGEVMQTFDRYARYQQAAAELADQPGLPLAGQFARVDALRRQMLGETLAEAFYGDEQASRQQLLQRLAIESERNLPDAEKARQLQALDAALPAAEREARARTRIGDLVQQQTALLDDTHADPATRYAERAQTWGGAAAGRLAQLDQQRALWQARLDAYAQQSQRISANDALDAQQRQAALLQLLRDSFHGPERIQVQAMMEYNSLPGTSTQ
ncbi:MAG: hypothetical protein KGJ32_10830 [Xanthomonadaceae bacterium]|nr:hypothetical protein [Xanthomonadaceae bacterium]